MDKKVNPFLIKFITSVESYCYTFLAPILVLLLTHNIKYSGGFFFIEAVFKFFSYAFAGSVSNHFNIKKVLKVCLTARFFITMNALLIFFAYPGPKILYLMVNGWLYYISNSFYMTAFETIFQKQAEFSSKTQALLSSGELLSGGSITSLLLAMVYFKINYVVLIPVLLCFYIYGMWLLSDKLSHIKEFHVSNNHNIVVNFLRDFSQTIKTLVKYKNLMVITFLGYFPLVLLLITEQKNLYLIKATFNESTTQLVHFGFKIILFFISGIIIHVFSKKWEDTETEYLLYSLLCLFIGIVGTLIDRNVVMNLIGFVFLGMSHYLMILYRKIRRRSIMIENNIAFHSLGIFFAIEGLSGVISYSFLSIFGENYLAFFTFSMSILIMITWVYKWLNMQNLMANFHKK